MKRPKKSPETIKYEIDPYNRLVIVDTGRKTKLSRFRHVVAGRFKVDKNNSLSYIVRAPIPPEAQIPHQVKLDGQWSLNDDHSLCLSLDKQARQTLSDKLTIQGRVLDVRENSLLFAVSTRTQANTQSIYTLKLEGQWQADKYNRITFAVKKQQGRHDILTFNGAWILNNRHRIIYQYEKADMIRKQKRIHTLIFKGYWDIKDKARLYYYMDKKSDSVFAFQTGVGIFKDNCIKYKVGIGASGKRKPVTRVITLDGTWVIKKGIGLSFEVEYENKEIHAIAFCAEAKVTSRGAITFELKNAENKALAAEVKLSHEILKGQGEAFLKFLKSRQESAAFVGAGFEW